MNTEDMALSLFTDAEYSVKESENAFTAKRYHRAVRRAQETVELCLKAALRLLGAEYPKKHDVSSVLKRVAVNKCFPQWFIRDIPQFALKSKRLAEERGPAFYGDETLAKPPASLYHEKDAEAALRDASLVLEATRKLIDWWKSSGR
nr:HEPN domain-containing protein [Candidatus Njordarchaeota archaeon]